MRKAEITKAVVAYNKGTYLMAVAECGDEKLNIQVKFNWHELDTVGFLKDLREKIAEDFDIPVTDVDHSPGRVLAVMKGGSFH